MESFWLKPFSLKAQAVPVWRALVLVRSFLAPALCSFLDLLLLFVAPRCCRLLSFCSTPLQFVLPGVVVGEELSIEQVLTLSVISVCISACLFELE